MTTLFSKIECLECGHIQEAKLFPDGCPNCNSAWLDAKYDLEALPDDWKERVKQRPTNLWRYEELLPLPAGTKINSMGEGWTPLTRAEGLEKDLGVNEIWLKDERQQPTGSFKDRQAASATTALRAEGVKELVLASTGNAAAAYAAFCARAGIKLWVFLTSMVPAEKMRELALYGAEVIKITGTYDQAKKIAHDFATRRNIHYDKGAKAIPDREVMKTLAFEIVEQLGWKAPDWYVQAVSGGLGPIGVQKGFEELYEVGIIDKIPKIGIVQVDGCAPMVHAWENDLDEAIPVVPDTLITVLATGDPGFAYQFLKKANDRYGGAMVSVSDADAFRAMRRVARSEGFSVEPATSVAFAGLEKMVKKGYIKANEVVALNCSGHTFSAEKHALEDRLHIDLQMETDAQLQNPDGLEAALELLDEQVTSIVVIDDNPQDRRLVRRLMQKHKKYRIFEAHNGADGIDLVKQRLPDMVVLDLTLPDMDGFSIMEALKREERTCDIPVMIVSGRDLTPDQKAFLDQTAANVMLKGNFSGQELVSNVVEMLGDEVIQDDVINTDKLDESVVIKKDRVGFSDDARPKILVVDDNHWDARLMRRLFEAKNHFEVVEVENINKAWQVIEKRIPDLIILDLMLPDQPGENLLGQLQEKKNTENIPVIVLTGKELETNNINDLIQQADSFWSKTSLDRINFLEHVENMLLD